MGELLKEMGQRILDRRKQLNMTQEALAKKSSCHAANHFYSGIGNKGDAAGNYAEHLRCARYKCRLPASRPGCRKRCTPAQPDGIVSDLLPVPAFRKYY